MLKRKNKRIQPRRLLSFGLIVTLFSFISSVCQPFVSDLKAQPFTSLPEPRFPTAPKTKMWADSFRKAETVRMSSNLNAKSHYLRITNNCTDSNILALSYYRLAQLESQNVYAENFINKALEIYPEQQDFLMCKAEILEKSFKFNESWPLRSQLIRLQPRFISRYKLGIYTATMAGLEDSAEFLRTNWKTEFGGMPPQGFVKFGQNQKPKLESQSVQSVHDEITDFESKILLAFQQRDSEKFIELTEELESLYPFLQNHQKCHEIMHLELSEKCNEAQKLWREISTNPENIPETYKSLHHLCP